MDNIERVFEDIDDSIQEGIDQENINFATRHDWGYEKFQRLLEVNNVYINSEEEDKEDVLIQEYKEFAASMAKHKKNFRVPYYIHVRYGVIVVKPVKDEQLTGEIDN